MLYAIYYILLALPVGLLASAKYQITVSDTHPFSLTVKDGRNTIIDSIGILAGKSNSSAALVSASSSGKIVGNGGVITSNFLNPTVARIQVNTTRNFVGAKFAHDTQAHSYGVWEYPWFGHITNANVSFDLKGLGVDDGVNWSNARAPFFLTSAGYGVYIDTLSMASFNFITPGQNTFIFNSTSLLIYVILPTSPGDYKSIISQYAALSSYIEMPPDSGYGPIYFSDDFEQDFHGSVSNAQENYYDVVNHLFFNEIRSSAFFADRPYGTGNGSWGNFDFDPVFYPTPKEFIANLTEYGFDFQVWVSNRATPDTKLWNISVANDWQFKDINYTTLQGGLQGPALNLSIPAAYSWFKRSLQVFTDLGVKGYKIDRGEEGEMPVYEQNIQMSLFEQLCYESMVEAWGPSGFFTFARSAVDRSRSRTAVWNGDSHANFSGLAYTVASGIRSGLIGFSTWGSDTGGYIRDSGSPTQEVWARWMHFATFSPMYELMLGTGHTPWYDPYTSELVQVMKKTADLHVELLPYIKSYTYVATKTGVPVMRALFLEAPNDSKTFTIDDQYFFGEELLVAPIVTAGGSRKVYFPKGATYLEYFNKTAVYNGGSSATVSMGLDYVPAYVKAGSIVPKGDIHQGNKKWVSHWEPYVDLELFPSFGVNSSRFVYYNGKTKKEVDVTLTTDQKSKTAKLVYGDLGYNGTASFFVKGGPRKVALVSGGGTANLKGFTSLFND